jgi:ABC-type multidrug transport system fused ATPase/permease subunit
MSEGRHIIARTPKSLGVGLRILIRIAGFAVRYKGQMFAAWATLILSTGFYVTIPRLLGTAIDDAFSNTDTGRLLVIAGLIVGATAARGTLQYANMYLAEAVSQKASYSIRNALYDKLQRLSFAFHDRSHTGDLMSKATVDVEVTRMFISMGLVRSGQIVLLSIFAAAIMLTIDWQLGLVSLFFVPVIAFRAVTISWRLRGIWRRAQDQMGVMTTLLQENLSGMRVVKAFGAEDHERAKFGRQIARVRDTTLEAQRTQAANSAFMQLIFWGSTGVILWFGGRAVIESRVTIGELAQFILYTSLLVQPIRMIGMLVNNFARAISAGERLFEVLDAESPVRERKGAVPLPEVRGEVAFEDVGFAYVDQPAVEHVSIHANPGEVVALLGAPGSGKTTLASLLARFYDVDTGRITIDGIDIRDVRLGALRQAIGIVQQDVFLFSASVRDNIAYGREDASIDDVMAAAKTAQLHDEIMGLPEGYATVVGERGMSLSGGQRQRLSIARTLMLDPPVLVLDDSTSSVDAGTEALIQRAVAAVVRGRTTFVIAHRLSSIQHARQVVVLEKGRIVEIGAPHDLLTKEGFFQHIAELQEGSVDLFASPVDSTSLPEGRQSS